MADDSEQAQAIMRDVFATEWLNSVIFVMDYVQFTFNGPILTTFTWPTIEVDGVILRWRDRGYRDALCEQIEHYVVDANVRKDDALELIFDTGAILRISLKTEDLRGTNPEAAMFNANLPTDKRWFVLRPGD